LVTKTEEHNHDKEKVLTTQNARDPEVNPNSCSNCLNKEN
jgi:hypothetical protein